MKQTSNAIKYLLAQYRAIYKHAALQSLCAAAVLTTGLVTASSANAVNFGDLKADKPIYITGSTSKGDDNNEDRHSVLSITSTSTNTTNPAELNITIQGSLAGAPNKIEADLTGVNSTFNINGTDDSNAALTINGSDNGTDVTVKNFNVYKGILTISGGSTASHHANLKAEKIVVGKTASTDGTANGVVVLTGNSSKASNAVLGIKADESNSGSEISITAGGLLKASGTSTSGSAIIQGKTLSVENQGTLALVANSSVTTDALNVKKGGTLVISGSTSFTGHSGSIAGNLLVQNGNTLELAHTNKKENEGTANEKTIVGKTTITKDSNVVLSGTLAVSKGILSVEKDTVLNAATTSGNITVDAGKNLSSATRDVSSAQLQINSADLKKFLEGKNKYHDITYEDNNSKTTISTTAGKTSASGSIILKSGGLLALQDTEQVDLATAFKFTSGDSNTSGTISLDSNASGGAIQGDKLAVSEALKGSDGSALNSAVNLYLYAKELTLGSDKYAGSGDLKFKSANVSDSLILKASGTKSFTLQNNITLGGAYFDKDGNVKTGTYYVQDADGFNTDKVSDAKIISGSDVILSGSTLSVVGGNWKTSGQDITLGGGAVRSGTPETLIAVGPSDDVSTSDSKYFNKGNIASLTIDGGDLNFKKGSITVKGKKANGALLDLSSISKVTFEGSAKSGTITISGDVQEVFDANNNKIENSLANGYGVLKVNGSSFLTKFLDKETEETKNGNTALEISGGGVLLVKSPDSSTAYKFTDFVSKNSGSGDVGVVTFTGAGYAVFEGDLKLEDNKPATTETLAGNEKKINIGSGTIVADNLILNNYAKGTDDKYKAVEIESGNFILHKVLKSEINTDLTLTKANLKFDGSGDLAINTTVNSGSKLDFYGTWKAKDITLNGQTNTDVVNLNVGDGEEASSLAISNLATSDNNNIINIAKKSKASTETAQIGSGTNLNVSGEFTFSGNKELAEGHVAYNKGLAGVNVNGAKINIGLGGKVTLSSTVLGATFGGTDNSNKSITFDSNSNATLNDALKATYSVANGATLVFDFGENFFGHALTGKEVKSIKDSVFGTEANSLNGIFSLGSTEFDIKWTQGTENSDYPEVTWDNIKDFSHTIGGKTTNDKLMKALVTDVKSTDKVLGQYGSMRVANGVSESQPINVSHDFGLHNAYQAKDGNKYFAFKDLGNGSYKAMSVKAENGATVDLANGGIIGSVSTSNAALNVTGEGVVDFQGEVTVSSSNLNSLAKDEKDRAVFNIAGKAEARATKVTTSSLNVDGVLTVAEDLKVGASGNNADKVYFDANAGSSITAKNIDSHVLIAASGNITAQEKLTAHDGIQIGGGKLVAKEVVLTINSGALEVGVEATKTASEEKSIDQTKSYSGLFEAKQLTLNDNLLKVSPSAGGNARSFASVSALSDSKNKTETLDGNVFVGSSSVLGIGSANLDELRKVYSEVEHAGTVNGTSLYLEKKVSLENGKGLTLTSLDSQEFAKQMNELKEKPASSIISNKIDKDAPTYQNTAYLGSNTVLVLNDKLLSSVEVKRGEDGTTGITQGVINFAGSNGTVVSDGGRILVDGKVRGSKVYQIFSQGNGTSYQAPTFITVNGKDYTTSADLKLKDGETASKNSIDVSTVNQFLVGEVDKNGQARLKLSDRSRDIMGGASDPVYKSLVAYAVGYNGEADKDGNVKEEQYLYYGTRKTNERGVSSLQKDYDGYYNEFLQKTVNSGNGQAAEQVSRFGTYAGVAQSALMSATSTYNAIASRMGIGVQHSIFRTADNGQGANLFVAANVESLEADDFKAQGLKYGVDIDIRNFALGTDFTFNNGMRVGLLANLGSGDAKGKDAAQGVNNDFDFYSVASYVGYNFKDLAVVADLSYSVVDNDVTGYNNIDNVHAQVDGTALSLGVQAKYGLKIGGIEVAPHAGLRFTSFDMDNYDIKNKANNSVIAKYDADRMNVFAIPVGVSFSKEYISGRWNFKPTLDLSVTANVGDDTTDGTVTWSGVSNLATNTSTEVLDSFNYGVNFGVVAKSERLAVSLGGSYTGSSNTNSVGLNASARLMF